ncbi:YsnF/AvaK domain-containing protein [Azospirillum sp. sgz302134]
MTTDAEPKRVVIPVVQETVEIEKHVRPTGIVHVHRRVHEETERIDEPLESVEVVVERVPVGRWLDTPVGERQEGDTTIIPVIEEVPVIVKRLRLVEEVHVTRRRVTHRYRDRVTVRRTDVAVKREDALDEDVRYDEPLHRHHSEQHDNEQQERRRARMITVIGLYQTPEPARRAQRDLTKAGCAEDSIQIFDKEQSDMVRKLADLGIDEEDGKAFSGAVARGAAVVAVEVEDDRADDIRTVLERCDARAVDVYEDEKQEQQQRERQTLREVEERVQIGKRRVVRGGVRATTHVTERPVERKLNLEEEKVRVRHREADRELSPDEAEDAFKEASIEMTETTEEAQVRKAARLIGEVELTKTTNERQETVHETARKTEVDVERMGGQQDKGSQDRGSQDRGSQDKGGRGKR